MNTMTRWDPMQELQEVQNRLARFFNRPTLPNGNESLTVVQWSPTVDISEDDKEFLIKAELPGLKREDVKVTVEDGVLSISGERKIENEEKTKKYHRVERSYGSFVRSFSLPEGADPAKVQADFKDGLLNVHIAKNPKAQPKTVAIQ